MTAGNQGYVRRETMISTVINMVIGAVFFVLVFHGQDRAMLWGPSGVVIDCLPQGFMIGLMGALVPTLIARRRIVAGLLSGQLPTIPQLIVRSVLAALAAMLAFTGVAAAIAYISGATSIAFLPGAIVKSLAGGVVAAIVTRTMLHTIFRASEPFR